jgi:hypothetical protein
MANFIKISPIPIIAFDELPIQVNNAEEKDLSKILSREQYQDLMSKLMDIVSKSKGAIVAKPIRGKQYVSAVVRPKGMEGKTYAFPEPNPVQLYYKIANEHLEKSAELQHEFLKMHGAHPEEFTAFCKLFEETAQGVIFLMMTIEGFNNQLLSDKEEYTINGQTKTKKQLELAHFPIKMDEIIPEISGRKFKDTHPAEHTHITELNSFRNALVHLKKIEQENFTFYEQLCKRVLEFNALIVSNAVFSYIECIRPGFFVLIA